MMRTLDLERRRFPAVLGVLLSAAVSAFPPGRAAAQIPFCVGDCDRNGAVSVDEIVAAVGAALGGAATPACPGLRADASAGVRIDRLVTAVRQARDGCLAAGRFFSFAGRVEEGVEVPNDGAALGRVEGLLGTRLVGVSPDGANVYATGEEHTIAVFRRDAQSGDLEPIDVVRDGERSVEGLDGVNQASFALSPNGAQLYAAARFTESVLTFDRDAGTGTLRFAGRFSDIQQNGPSLEEFPFFVTVSPDGAQVYVTGDDDRGGGTDLIVRFERDAESGALTWNGGARQGGGVAAVSPDGSNVYVTGWVADRTSFGEGRRGLAVLARRAGGAGLDLVEIRDGRANGVDPPDGPVVVSPDGAHVYVGGAGLSVFARDGDGGGLVLVESVRGPAIAGLAPSPDGTLLYATSREEGLVEVLGRNPVSGRLRPVDVLWVGAGLGGVADVGSVAPSPDGAQVYVADPRRSAVAWFRLDRAPLGSNGTACDEDDQCASGICDFAYRTASRGAGGGAGSGARVCCRELCTLDEFCNERGECEPHAR